MKPRLTTLAVVALASMLGACTVTDTQPPPLAGPSEMSLSLTLTANPDVLSLDGASQSQVRVVARDENGQPKSGVLVRAEILVNGVPAEYGALSARTRTTDSGGATDFTYRAPAMVGNDVSSVQLSVTPEGAGFQDAASHFRRLVTIRLVAPGVIGIAPTAAFTFTPEDPLAFTNVIFDGSTSTAAVGAAITTYRWDFGDGSTGSGATALHQYSAVGTYRVTLTVTDTNGLSHTSAPQIVSVGPGALPTASFLFSPTGPLAGDTVFFNASASVAGTGHRIVSYRWNWGDGKPSSTGVTRSHVFDTAGTYIVVLTVTDEVGQTATTNVEVPVQ